MARGEWTDGTNAVTNPRASLAIEDVWEMIKHQDGLRSDMSYTLEWADDEHGARCVRIQATSQEEIEASVLVPLSEVDEARLGEALEELHAHYARPDWWI
jgi:hypothetical protein